MKQFPFHVITWSSFIIKRDDFFVRFSFLERTHQQELYFVYFSRYSGVKWLQYLTEGNSELGTGSVGPFDMLLFGIHCRRFVLIDWIKYYLSKTFYILGKSSDGAVVKALNCKDPGCEFESSTYLYLCNISQV